MAGDRMTSFSIPISRSTITLRSLHTRALIGLDAWSRENRSQPLILSFELALDTAAAAASDDVAQTFSYGIMASTVLSAVQDQSFSSIDNLVARVVNEVAAGWPGDRLKITTEAPKALTRINVGLGSGGVTPDAEGTGRGLKEVLELFRTGTSSNWFASAKSYTIAPLPISCIIGVNPPERIQRQLIILKLTIITHVPSEPLISTSASTKIPHISVSTFQESPIPPETWPDLVARICEYVEQSSFYTVEALADRVANLIHDYCLPTMEQHVKLTREGSVVGVGIEKPAAITWAEGAGVYIWKEPKQSA